MPLDLVMTGLVLGLPGGQKAAGMCRAIGYAPSLLLARLLHLL
jgi:hypothetical protein